jgi:hypothetical protein
MSVHVMSWVLRHSEEKLGNRLVLLVLADYAADDGTHAFPKVDTIARDARLSRSQVQRCLRSLEENGSIAQTGKRSSGTREYRVLVEEGPQYATPGAASTTTGESEGPHIDTAGAAGRGPIHHEPPVTDEPPGTLAAVAAYDPLKGTKLDGRNVPWDALVKVTQADETAESGRIARALKTIRAMVVRDTSPQTFEEPETGEWWIARQISARANLYQRRWPGIELTPTALASNWGRVVTAQPGQDPHGTMEAAQRGIDAARRTA